MRDVRTTSLLSLVTLFGAAPVACSDDPTGAPADTGESTGGPTGGDDGSGGPTTQPGPTSTSAGSGSDDGVDTSGSATGDDTGTGSTTGGPMAEGRPDLDGDGQLDYVLSARGHDGFAGAVWIDYGADAIADGPNAFDTRLVGTSNFGLATTMCDLDGDEVDELVVGSLGGLHVYWGGAQLQDDATEDLLVTSADQLAVVGGIGCADVTGDGLDDIVSAGATFASWTMTIVPGAAELHDVPTLDADTDPSTIHIDSSDGSLLPALDLGDVNADGTNDIVVGGSFGGPAGEGAAYVFFGGAGLGSGTEASADVTLLGSAASAGFGTSLAVADLDGDGTADLAVAEVGRIALYPGGPAFSASPAPAPRLLAPGATVEGVAPFREIVFSDLGLAPRVSGRVGIVAGEPHKALAVAVTLGPTELFMVIDRPLDPEATVCSVEVDGMDQTAPDPVPDVYTPAFAMPVPDGVTVPVLRHGRTNPMTFQPDGDGRMQTYRWEGADCEIVVGEDGTITIQDLQPNGMTDDLWSDPEFWSNRNVRLYNF